MKYLILILIMTCSLVSQDLEPNQRKLVLYGDSLYFSSISSLKF